MNYEIRYSKLNERQKQAVNTIEGPVMVVAGPGTGKTELLSMRAANILRRTDMLPENILCLTFTESGSIAMQKRLVDIIGREAYGVSVFTFHAFGSEIISRYREYFYNGADFNPADELTRHKIITDILQELPPKNPLKTIMNGEFTSVGMIISAISDIKRAGLEPKELTAILDANDEVIDIAEPLLIEAFSARVNKNTFDKLASVSESLAKINEPQPIPTISRLSDILRASLKRSLEEASEHPKITPPLTKWRTDWMTKSEAKKPIMAARKQQIKLRALVDIYEKYLENMQSAKLYDFDDMISQVVHAIEQNPSLQAELQEKYQYIMVDEFQDTNQAQMRILHALTNNPANEGNPNLMVVGNPGKSITDSIAPYSDIFVTKEVSANTYLNNYHAPTSAFENNPANANRIMHIIYGATPAQYDEIIRLSRERNVGWLYIVNDTNYNNLPTNFSSLVDNINTPLVVPVLAQNSNKLMTRVISPSASPTQVPLEAPRSKVNLDLVKNVKSSIFQNLQNTEEGKTDVDFTFIGNFSTDYKDKKSSVEYDSDSRGILISLMKNFGKFTVGGGMGYQDSKVNYKGNFEGIDEKIKSHQFILSGKYEFNENIDLTNVLTYSGNSHKFKTETGAGLMNNVKYKSRILDYTTKLGYKFSIDNGFVKPYIGLAAIRVFEDKMDKLNISESTKSGLEWLFGVYAEKTIGQFNIFGKAEYELRGKKGSYHGERKYGNYKIAPLSYSRGIFNAELGTNYKINDYVKASLGYGLADSKNSSIKLGLEASF